MNSNARGAAPSVYGYLALPDELLSELLLAGPEVLAGLEVEESVELDFEPESLALLSPLDDDPLLEPESESVPAFGRRLLP